MLGVSLRSGPRAPPTSNVEALTRQLEDGEVEVNATAMTREELIEWSKRLKVSAHRVKTLKILCVPRNLMWATYHYSQMQQHPEVQHVFATPEHRMGVKIASANSQHHLVRMAFCKAVCAVLRKGPVEELVLGLRFSESGCTMLSDALAANTTLKRLSFAGSHMGDERFMWLKPGLKANNSLEELDLTACALTDEAAISMAAVVKSHVDRRLALVFDEQLRHYPDTSLPPHRAHLDHHTQLRAIAKSVDERCGGLLHLELAENKLTDKAVRPLCTALAYDRRLIFLSLRANKLTAAAEAEFVALMKEHQALLRVDLRQNADPKLGILKLKRRVAPRVFSTALGFRPNPVARGLQSPVKTDTSMPLWALRDEAPDSLGPSPMGTPRLRAPNSPGRMSAVSWGDMHLLVRSSPTRGAREPAAGAAGGRGDAGPGRTAAAARGPGGGAGGRASQAPWLARQPNRTGSLRRRALESTMSAPASPADSRQSSFQDFAQFAAGIQRQGGPAQHNHPDVGMSRLGAQAQGLRNDEMGVGGEPWVGGQRGGGGGGNGMPSVFGAPPDQAFFREATLSGDFPQGTAAAAVAATRMPDASGVYDTPVRGSAAPVRGAGGGAADGWSGGSPPAGMPPGGNWSSFGATAPGSGFPGSGAFPFGAVPLPGGLTLEDLPPALAMRVAQTVGRAAATMAKVGGPLPPTLQQLHTLLQSPAGTALAAAATAAVAAANTAAGSALAPGAGGTTGGTALGPAGRVVAAAPWVLLGDPAGPNGGSAAAGPQGPGGAAAPGAPPPGVWAQAVPLAVPLPQPTAGMGLQQPQQRSTQSAGGALAAAGALPAAGGFAQAAPVLPPGMRWAVAPAPAPVWLSPGNSGGGAAAPGDPAAWMAVPVAAAAPATNAAQASGAVPRPAVAPGVAAAVPQLAAAAALAPFEGAARLGQWPGAMPSYGAAGGTAGAAGLDASDAARQQAFLSMLHGNNLLAGQGDYDYGYLFSQPRAQGRGAGRGRGRAGQLAPSSSPGSMPGASAGKGRRAGPGRVKLRSAAKAKRAKRRPNHSVGTAAGRCRTPDHGRSRSRSRAPMSPCCQRGASPGPSPYHGSARKARSRTLGQTLPYGPGGKRISGLATAGTRGRSQQRQGPRDCPTSRTRSRSQAASSPRRGRRRQKKRRAAAARDRRGDLFPGATPKALATLERALLQMSAEVDALEAAAAAAAAAARQAETAAAAATEREAHERAAAAAADHSAATAAAERAARAAAAAEHAAVAAAERATFADRRAREASRRAKAATAERATVAATTAVSTETARVSALQHQLQSLPGVRPYSGSARGLGVNVNAIVQQLDRWCGLNDDALLQPPDQQTLEAALHTSSPRKPPTQIPVRSGQQERERNKETQTQQLADRQVQTTRPQESQQTQTPQPQSDQQTQTQAQLYMLEQLRKMHYQQQKQQLLRRLQEKLQQQPHQVPAAATQRR